LVSSKNVAFFELSPVRMVQTPGAACLRMAGLLYDGVRRRAPVRDRRTHAEPIANGLNRREAMQESTSGPVNPEGPPEEEPAAAASAGDEPTAEEPAATEPASAAPATEAAAPTQPTPTIATSGGGKSMSGKTILIGIIAIAIIAVAVWFFAFRGSGVGDKFVGTWVPIDTSNGGGGMIISKSGDTFKVAMVNETGGTDTTLTGKLKGDNLELTVPADIAAIAGNITFTATYVKATDHLMLKVGGAGAGSDQTIELKRASSIPVTSPSAYPSATPYSSGSPDAQIDLEIRTSTDMIAAALDAYAAANNGVYPSTADSATLASYANPWPTNPVTGAPIADSTSAGDFTYTPTSNFDGYTLAGHLTDGTDYTVARGSAASPSPSPSY
jgi:hypothetical protein